MITPPSDSNVNQVALATLKIKARSSNLELYRIIVMIMIVAHHYVVNSGLIQVIEETPYSSQSLAMLLFGAWGKTGINCFVLITGYFMCKSRFSWDKLLKLYLQITFYTVIIYWIFCWTGHEAFSIKGALKTFWPLPSISVGFVSCFIVFYMLIPFLNLLTANMNKEQHRNLLLVLLGVYSVLPTFFQTPVAYNYVTWFIVLYFLAAYLRFYEKEISISHRQWGIATLITLLGGICSIIGLYLMKKQGYMNTFMPYHFISDSNKMIALAIALCSFMWFKGLRIPQSKIINAAGAATFGVLLIHANSDAMRQWLWRETVDVTGHFSSQLIMTVGYGVSAVLSIFIICSMIDFLRVHTIEMPMVRLIKGFCSRVCRKTESLA